MAGGFAPVDAGVVDDGVPTEGKRTYAIIVCLFASLGGLFFGYDQGVTGGVLVMDGYLNAFCVGWHEMTYADCTRSTSDLPSRWIDFTTYFNVTYNLGSMFGALLGGWVADKLGRRSTIFQAGLIFCAGTCWVSFCPEQSHGLLLAGRFVQGMGVGNSSFSLPLFGAEMAPKELRGFLSGFMQMMVTTGLLLSNIVNQIIVHHEDGWRITYAVAMVAPIIVMLGIFFVPESPRWTYKHKGKERAQAVLMRLRQTDYVDHELQAIGDQIELEGESGGFRELWEEPSIRKRVIIAMLLQVFQQCTGINPILTYGGMVFEDVIGNGVTAELILSGVFFLFTIPGMRWVDTVGRRMLLLIGSLGMVLGHLVAAITFVVGCDGNTQDAGCSEAAGIIIIMGSCFFIFNFAFAWGPVCWVYAAEIFPLNVRASAVSLSTMANWLMGVVMCWVVKLYPEINIDGVFFLFCALCVGGGVFVYFFCPETKGLLLEDIEVLFNRSLAHKRPENFPSYSAAKSPA